AGLEAQMPVQGLQLRGGLGAVEADACRALQADQARARPGRIVVGFLAGLVEVRAFWQGQTEAGLRVDVRGHDLGGTGLRVEQGQHRTEKQQPGVHAWVAHEGPSADYLMASGLVGEPTAPVIGSAGATNRNSYTLSAAQSSASSFK